MGKRKVKLDDIARRSKKLLSHARRNVGRAEKIIDEAKSRLADTKRSV